ncbi:hypothetical protein ACH5RR_026629 [Cinchona calisaya]|uniref:Uncharacterized protein n=1 Tax=Cinchona calisaya TaxID=153742 RepID=A0ABD2Z348_9GENT
MVPSRTARIPGVNRKLDLTQIAPSILQRRSLVSNPGSNRNRMAQGNKPVICYHLAPGKARFMYAPPIYHDEIGVQNCHCGKTYPNHVTIHVAEERDHLLGEIEAYSQEVGVLRNRNIELQQENTMLQLEAQQETNLLYEEFGRRQFWQDRYHNSRNTYRHILQNVCHNLKLAYNHIMGLNGIDGESHKSNQEEHILAQEVEQVQGQPIGEMDGMMEEFEEDPAEDLEKEPEENHRRNV